MVGDVAANVPRAKGPVCRSPKTCMRAAAHFRSACRPARRVFDNALLPPGSADVEALAEKKRTSVPFVRAALKEKACNEVDGHSSERPKANCAETDKGRSTQVGPRPLIGEGFDHRHRIAVATATAPSAATQQSTVHNASNGPPS
jgi:hypothetical protein